MEIQFTQSRPQSARLVAQVTDKGKVPVGLDKAMTEGMEAARFKGNTGQVFDGFVDRDGQVFRLAIAGAGDAKDDARLANLEKAGAALTAKYQSIGNDELVLDLSDSNLSGEEAASVLFGLRLRNWRYDIYRTKMKDDQKVTLAKVTVVGAPEGTQAAWEDMAHVATGVELTRELITEPANILYPETFVERCQQRFEGTGAELSVLDEVQMEKLGSMVVLSLIVIVACFNIASTLTMLILEKIREIGILKTIGFSQARIGNIFRLQGIFIGGFGLLLGGGLGLLFVQCIRGMFPLLDTFEVNNFGVL